MTTKSKKWTVNDMRIIDADRARETATIDLIVHHLDRQPTIDAVPARYGKWNLNRDGSGTCNQCHFTQMAVWDMDGWQNFCGVCGADMRDGKGSD